MTNKSRRLPTAADVALTIALLGCAAPVAFAGPADGRFEVAQAVKNNDADDKDNNKKKKAKPGQNQGGAGAGNANAPNPNKDPQQRPGQGQAQGKKAGAGQGAGQAAGQGQGKKQGQGKGPGQGQGAGQGAGQAQGKGPGQGQGAGQAAGQGKGPGRGQGQGGQQNVGQGAGQGAGKPFKPQDDDRRNVQRPAQGVSPAGGTGSGYANIPWKRPDPVVVKRTYKAPPKPAVKWDEVRTKREVKTVNNVRIYKEVDRRVIIKQDNRVFINHDESERFRRISHGATTVRRSDGFSETVIVRDGGVKIINVVDDDGYLVYRSRRDRFGSEVIIIDNRHHRDHGYSGRDVALGVGAGLVLGAALVALAPPVHAIPPEKYVVDYGRASDDDVYEALTAPPVERLDRNYSLDEVRYSEPLRERMRRIDLDSVTFDSGSWEVEPGQYRALEKIADGIMRALDRNADEVFLVEGHTDAVGDEDDNLSLSDRRAQSVAEILTSEFGVPPENLVTQGYGEQFLKIPTDGPERANRRIVVRRISPLMSEKFRN